MPATSFKCLWESPLNLISPNVSSSLSQGHDSSPFPGWSLCFQASLPSLHPTYNCHISFPTILLYYVPDPVHETVINLIYIKFKTPNTALTLPPLLSTRSTYFSQLSLPPTVSFHMAPHTSSFSRFHGFAYAFPLLPHIPYPFYIPNKLLSSRSSSRSLTFHSSNIMSALKIISHHAFFLL